MERFFVTSPIIDFSFPMILSHWFCSETVRLEKRREIANVICSLTQDSQVEFPTLHYYGDSQNNEIVTILDDTDVDELENGIEENGNDENFINNNDFNFVDSNTDAIIKNAVNEISVDGSEIENEDSRITPILSEYSLETEEIKIDNQKTDPQPFINLENLQNSDGN